MTTVLSLATFPIKNPRHGGQRRITAFDAFYRSIGLEFAAAAVVEPAYADTELGQHDLRLSYLDRELANVPFVTDILSGRFAANDRRAYQHFRHIVTSVRPDALQLDHPFMWPLVQKLLDDLPWKPKFIYSSHNWEAPLKEKILRDEGIPRARIARIIQGVEELERQSVAAADVVIAVSAEDAMRYQGFARSARPIILVPNGVNRPFKPTPSAIAARETKFGKRKIFLFVGSAYPPNIQGFGDLVAEGGFYFFPPETHLAVCGSAADPIWIAPQYQRLLHGNSARVHFYPNISDDDLEALKQAAHVFLLPITYGGGTNLKTAEALVNGKHIIATPVALRGFDGFQDAPGVRLAADRESFRKAMIDVFHEPPLVLSTDEVKRRESLFWDQAFANSGFHDALRSLNLAT